MCLAIPGRLEAKTDDPLMPMGTVRFGGITKEICLACVPDAKIGHYVLVHVGMAIACIDEDEARRTLAHLEEINELDEISR